MLGYRLDAPITLPNLQTRIGEARSYSKVLALQIKARKVGIPTPFISWPRCITRAK
jgi:hypothetical protein